MFVRVALVACLAAGLWAWFARPSGGARPEERYVVKPYDTLWSIAASHYAGDPREAVWKVEVRNRLTGTTLRPGQTLVLP